MNRFRKALELHFAFPPGKKSIKIIDQFPKTYKRLRPGADAGVFVDKSVLGRVQWDCIYGSAASDRQRERGRTQGVL